MIDRFLCFIGYHEWAWQLPKDGRLSLSAPVPPYAGCTRCGVLHGPIPPNPDSL